MDLVSVIIPTHNGSKYIERALHSVQKQTYSELEIIVVDDNGRGSEEQLNTEEIVKKFSSDNRVRYYTHEKNKNGSAARNTGFRYSLGKFIALLDDDDWYLPEKIEMEIKILKKLDSEWGMVYCSSDKNQFLNKKSGDLLFDLLLHKVIIGSNSFLIRREVWEKVGGFDESFKRHQDFEFTARVASICKIKGINRPGFVYNPTIGRNKAKNINQLQEHRIHYIEKMLPQIRKFSNLKQKIIICSNVMQVTSPYLSQGNPLRFFIELKQITNRWNPKCGISIITYVALMKCSSKIIQKLQQERFKNDHQRVAEI